MSSREDRRGKEQPPFFFRLFDCSSVNTHIARCACALNDILYLGTCVCVCFAATKKSFRFDSDKRILASQWNIFASEWSSVVAVKAKWRSTYVPSIVISDHRRKLPIHFDTTGLSSGIEPYDTDSDCESEHKSDLNFLLIRYCSTVSKQRNSFGSTDTLGRN